jgi:hypothetical protein
MSNYEFGGKQYNLETQTQTQEKAKTELKNQVDNFPFAQTKNSPQQTKPAFKAFLEAMDEQNIKLAPFK